MEHIKETQIFIMVILQALYYISGIGILIVAIIGLKQLKIAKQNLIIRSRREAATLAAEQSKHYIENIIPMLNAFDDFLEKKGFEEYEGKISTYTSKDLKDFSISWFARWLKLVIKEDPDIKGLNALDGFASFFTNKIADDEIAFNSVGLSFCDSVESIYPFIVFSRKAGEFSYYHNVIELYKIWKKRIDKLQLQDKIGGLQKTLNEISDVKIDPIGTK